MSNWAHTPGSWIQPVSRPRPYSIPSKSQLKDWDLRIQVKHVDWGSQEGGCTASPNFCMSISTCICATLSSTIAHESFLQKQNPTPAPPVAHMPTATRLYWLPSLTAHPTAQVSDHPTPCCQATAAHNKQSSSIRGILAQPIHGFVAIAPPAFASAARRDKWRCELPAATCP